MCGLAGFTYNNNKKIEKGLELIKKRGPDSSGIFCDENISIGHRRLSIIDLTENGNQPFASHDKNLIIAFNGEIYNFKELRENFPDHIKSKFKSKSDTEVILYGYELYGIDFFSKMRGMWAVVLYDKKKNKIILSRDYFGIKPLYYAVLDNILYFGSEMKVLVNFIEKKEPNTEYYFQYFNLGYFIPPETCYKNIKKVLPGEILIWNLKEKCIIKGHAKLIEKKSKIEYVENIDEAVKNVEQVMIDSVASHFISDVPVGLLLSGGNDSSLLAALSVAVGKKPIAYNLNIRNSTDSRYAEKISAILGLELVKFNMTDELLEKQYEKIWDFVDEPIADSSIIPTSLIYSFIKGKAKVVISGEGGDEMFGGYVRHNYFARLKNITLNNKKINFLNKLEIVNKFSFEYSNPVINRLRNHLLNYRIDDLIGSYLAYTKIIDLPIYYKKIRKSLFNYYNELIDVNKPANLFFDRWLYLPNDLMYKNDMASMAYSIESRLPLLDKKLFNVLQEINPEFCLSPEFSRKFLLKKVMEKYLPSEFIYRPKKGFSFSFEKYGIRSFNNDLKEALIFHKQNADNFGLSASGLLKLLSPDYSDLIIKKFQSFAFAMVSNYKIFK